MDSNLEHRVCLNCFKSKGESKIAQFLAETDINFEYERPLLIRDADSKTRIYYPDFWLPDYAMGIEYFGLDGASDAYDERTSHKLEAYNKELIEIISIYPKMFRSDWQGHIIGSIGKCLKKRVDNYRERAELFEKARCRLYDPC